MKKKKQIFFFTNWLVLLTIYLLAIHIIFPYTCYIEIKQKRTLIDETRTLTYTLPCKISVLKRTEIIKRHPLWQIIIINVFTVINMYCR